MSTTREMFRISIRYKLYAIFTILIVFISAVIGTIMIKRQKMQFLDQLTQFGVYVTSYLAQTSAEPLLFGDDLAMSLLVRDLARNPDVIKVMIVDKNGEIQAHNNTEQLGAFYVDIGKKDRGKLLENVHIYHEIRDGEQILEFSLPYCLPGNGRRQSIFEPEQKAHR